MNSPTSIVLRDIQQPGADDAPDAEAASSFGGCLPEQSEDDDDDDDKSSSDVAAAAAGDDDGGGCGDESDVDMFSRASDLNGFPSVR